MKKDIREYLHYYRGISFEAIQNGQPNRGVLGAVFINSDSFFTVWDSNSDTGYGSNRFDLKFYLSRLEDMSYEDFMSASSIHVKCGGQLLLTFSDIKIDPKPRPIYPEVTHFLIKKGYWLFGNDWFDEGLIIDRKTLKP